MVEYGKEVEGSRVHAEKLKKNIDQIGYSPLLLMVRPYPRVGESDHISH